ncbi:MAG: hypothetical protein HZB53_10410 [Chloroflexi bacterium]|nr:hypothetical protein [Chloroflexota bacterium]
MKSKILVLSGMVSGLVLAAVVAFAALSAPAAYAQGPVGTPAPRGPGYGGMMGGGGYGGMMGGPANLLVAVAAKVLGIEQADLVKALSGGQTIADVAKSKGVATDKIVDAFVAQRAEFLQSAVASGRLTQAQADANLAAMKAHIATQLTAKFTPGNGPAFADSDNDGICDNLENGTQPGTHMQNGGMRGRWNR